MFFNVQRNGNRNYIDTGDLKQYLMKLTITNKKMDKLTLALISDILTYIENSFNEVNPSDKTIYPLDINDYYLNRRMNDFLKKNKSKSLSSLDIDMSDEIPAPPIIEFNEKQIAQFEDLINKHNSELFDKIRSFYLSKEKKENKGIKTK